jgi:hypothetical protein
MGGEGVIAAESRPRQRMEARRSSTEMPSAEVPSTTEMHMPTEMPSTTTTEVDMAATAMEMPATTTAVEMPATAAEMRATAVTPATVAAATATATMTATAAFRRGIASGR